MPNASAGSRTKALDWPPTLYVQDDTENTSVTSDDFTTGGHPLVAGTFTANTFGKAKITVGAMARGGSTGNRVDVAPELYKGTSAGSGELIYAASILARGAASAEGTVYMTTERSHLVINLEPGATYYIRLLHKRNGSASTGAFTRRWVLVSPAT